MAKQNKLDSLIKAKSPLERQAVTPVDVLETERSNGSDERNEHADTPNGRTDRANRTVEPFARTEQVNRPTEPNGRTDRANRSHTPNDRTERSERTVLNDLEQGTPEETKRDTERYSFEIYTDQKESIEELQYLYKKKTGKKLSASRIIREALAEYLDKALQTFKE